MRLNDIRISDFNYELPEERIAMHPLAERDKCKLLVMNAFDGKLRECVFDELPMLLPENSMLVYNNTRVINARLRFHKAEGGAQIEIFCLEPHCPVDYAENFASCKPVQWLCFVGNSKRWKSGSLQLPIAINGVDVILTATRIERVGNASIVEFSWDGSVSFAEIIEAAGEIPIPPYLNRSTEVSDSVDYQTVYSVIRGSVAAPTAGLHFTDRVLAEIDLRRIPRRALTLHVGAGTFQPVKEENVANHEMHSEFISVPLRLIEELAETERQVFAVGTTSVRTLESLYHIGCLISQNKWNGEVPQWYPYDDSHPHLTRKEALSQLVAYLRENGLNSLIASTRIIIAPGYEYQIVSGMLTNFHQPKSTLLLLVSAFVGDQWKRAYEFAMQHDFRFLSYGDACLFLKDRQV